MASAHVAPPPDLLRLAAEFRWANPSATWEQIAEKVGRSRRQVERWRHTEAWEIAFREAGTVYIERLAPAAVSALVKAWAKGNPAGAVDVLRSFGFLHPTQIRVETDALNPLVALQRVLCDLSPDVRAEVADRLDRLEG